MPVLPLYLILFPQKLIIFVHYKKDIPLKEYGSNVQKLADHIVKIEDKAKRTLYAHILVELMRQIHPNMRDNQDYTNKLWDDLYIISGFELDVDSPFPPPSKEALGKKPLRVDYNQQNLTFRHYGRNIDLLLEKASQTENPEDRLAFMSYIFRLMRSFFNAWNKDNPEDSVLLSQLEHLSKGRLKEEIDYIRKSGPIDAARLKTIKYDTAYAKTGYAKAWMARLLALDTKGDPALAEAQGLLRQWDWNLDGKGKGDALALMVLRPANGSHYQRKPEPDPRQVLSDTVNHLQEHFAGLDPKLGDVLRLRHGEGAHRVDLPLDGGNDTVRASTLWDVEPDGRLKVRHGDSFIMFVTWDKAGQVHSESIQPFGAATTRPDSPHYNDQAPLFVAHRLKPVLFDPAALRASGARFYRP